MLYVYLHLDDQGEPFYAGRGRGARAWEVTGGPTWEWFVRERLGGCYHVLVLAKDLTDALSEQILEEMMAAYGKRLLNVANYHRGMNYAALKENDRLRKELRPLYDEVAKITDPNERLALSRRAIAIQSAMDELDTEQGRFGEVLKAMGALSAMDNVFITHAIESLMEQGRVEEAKTELTEFLAKMHPTGLATPRIERLIKMVARDFQAPAEDERGGMSELFDRIVRDAMAKFGWSRTNAEKVAKRVEATTVANASKAEAAAAKRARKATRKKRKRMAAIPALKPAKAPMTAKERMERALGPDDGPRRGGSPFVQGGSPGLGKRS